MSSACWRRFADWCRIFPARIREPGIAVGVASQWLFNFVFSLSTPYMMDSMGWGTFLLWGLFDAAIATLTFLFLRETKGLSLETIAQTQYKRGAASQVAVNTAFKGDDYLAEERERAR